MTVARRLSALHYATVMTALLAGSAAYGKASAPPFLETAGVIDAPHGFVEMCKSDSSFCARTRTSTSQDDMHDIAGHDPLSMPAPPLSTVSVAFHMVAPLLHPAVGTAITIGWSAFASPLVSCPSLSGNFSANDGASSLEVLAPVSRRNVAPGLSLLNFGQPRGPFALPATCSQDIGIAPLARLDTGAIRHALAPPFASAAPASQPRMASANEADKQALLQRINRLVNGRVRQRTDLEIYGQAEVWRRSGIGKGAAGDCEDLAIEKRFELADAGFPADHLSFAVVYAHGIGLHTVLVAHLSSGDYVLDSRTPYVQPWADAPYRWIALQSTEDPMAWHAVIGGGRKV